MMDPRLSRIYPLSTVVWGGTHQRPRSLEIHRIILDDGPNPGCPPQPSPGHRPMGQISDKLVKRLGKNRKLADELRRESGSIQAALVALKNGAATRLSHGVALDPLHTVHVAVQNVTSVFAERVSLL